MKRAILSNLVATLSVLAYIYSLSVVYAEETFDLQLAHPQQSHTEVLTSMDADVAVALQIDVVNTAFVTISCSSKDLEISITDPNEETTAFGDTSIESGIVSSFVYPEDALTNEEVPGVQYCFVLQDPPTGEWTVSIGEPSTIVEDIMVVVDVFSDSKIRGQVLIGNTHYPVGATPNFFISIVDENGLQAGYDVIASITNVDVTSPSPVALTFTDQEDGTYAASYECTEPGFHIIVAHATGMTTSSQLFHRTLSAAFEVFEPIAGIEEESVQDGGLDNDGDGLFDEVFVSYDINVHTPKALTTSVMLESSADVSVSGFASTTPTLEGIQPIQVYFPASELRKLQADGPWTIKRIELQSVNDDTLPLILDWYEEAGETASYSLAACERVDIQFEEFIDDEAVDSEGEDDLYDELNVEFAISVVHPGDYVIEGTLVDSYGQVICQTIIEENVVSILDPVPVTISFDGSEIGDHGIDGPFQVKNIRIASAENGAVRPLAVDQTNETDAYAASDFTEYVPFSDCNSNTIPDFVEADLNHNGVPDECDISDEVVEDVNENGIPDLADADLNFNGIPDFTDLTNETSGDCNENEVPDDAEQPVRFRFDSGILPELDSLEETPHVESLPRALGPVSIRVAARGSYIDSDQFLILMFGVNAFGPKPLASVFTRLEGNYACPERGAFIQYVVTPEIWNYHLDLSEDFETPAEFYIKAQTSVERSCGDNGFVRYWIEYPADGGNDDLNDNDVPDASDILCDDGEDVNDNGILDDYELDINENGIPDDIDVANGLLDDCNGNGVPDATDISSSNFEDVNSNDIPDTCETDCDFDHVPDVYEISQNALLDCNTNGLLDSCEPDCNGNENPDDCDIADEISDDVNENDVPDECEDCNANAILDPAELISYPERDLNENDILDSCEPTWYDCDENNEWDVYEIADDAGLDVNGNGNLDVCDEDCNENDVADHIDIYNTTSTDCNLNGAPDECELVLDTEHTLDCDENGLIDSCEISAGTAVDLNTNQELDSCEIAATPALDENENGILDDFELNVVYSYRLDSDPGWSRDPQWAFGPPMGQAGDPDLAFTGENVFGFNLWGAYANNLGGGRYLTTTAIDCSDLNDVYLEFRRWMTCKALEGGEDGLVSVQVSNNGTTWEDVWWIGDETFTGDFFVDLNDDSWKLRRYDISAVAANESTVYIRWRLGATDAEGALGGWNLDDVKILSHDLPDAMLPPQGFAPVSLLNKNAVSDDGDDFAPCLKTDGDGIWIAAWTSTSTFGDTIGSDYDILYSRSLNDGTSWSMPQALNTNAAIDSGNDDVPELATDGAGNWIAVWSSTEQYLDDGGTIDVGEDNDIFYATSANDGATWSAPLPLNSNATTDSGNDLIPRIASDKDGEWMVVWGSTQNTLYDSLDNPINTGGDLDILFATSSDNGGTWSLPLPVNSDATSDSSSTAADTLTSLQTDENGRWVVIWNDFYFSFIPIPMSVSFTYTDNDGGTWSTADTMLEAEEMIGFAPTLATDKQGNWVTTWMGATIDPPVQGIYANTSTDNGETWTTATLVSASFGEVEITTLNTVSSIATDGQGVWLVVWSSAVSNEEELIDDRNIIISRSEDNGLTWSEPATVNSTGRFPGGDDNVVRIETDGVGLWGLIWASTENLYGALGDDFEILKSFSDSVPNVVP